MAEFTIGATLFPALWAYTHDRARLQADVTTLADGGVDWVRVFGAVGPGGPWDGRTVDPTAPGFPACITGLMGLLSDAGLQVQWTILAGLERLPTPADRIGLIDMFAAAARGHENDIHSWEIANESFINGPEDDELRALAARLKPCVPQPLALSSPAGDATALYAGSVADLVTYHLARQPLPSLVDAWSVNTALPWISNEPTGPGSSVFPQGDPRMLALAAAAVKLAGGIGYCLHTGAGTYMRTPLRDVPRIAEMLALLRAVRDGDA